MPQTIMPKQKTSSDGLLISGYTKKKSTARSIGDPYDATRRLASFSHYLNVPVQPKILAEAGFYYVGQENITQCYSCGSCVQNWDKEDNPLHVKYHKEDCTINGLLGQREQVQEPTTSAQQSVASNNSLTLRSSDQQHSATNATEMNQVSQRESTTPATISSQNQSLSTIFLLENPINPHMRNEDVRLSTFRDNSNWHDGRISATSEEIAKAGFFYLGISDKVKCFYCNGGLERWEYSDNPWIEHAKWYPHCEFTLRHKGPAFVSDITSQFPNINRPPPAGYDIPPNQAYENPHSWVPPRSNGFSRSRGAEIVDPREEDRKREILIESAMTSSDLVKNARDMGFADNQIRKALQKQYQVKEREFSNIEELLETLNNIEGEEVAERNTNLASSQTLQQTNNPIHIPSSKEEQQNRIKQLEEEKKCKICLDEISNVVFVPCGHLSTCVSCAQRVSNCPICRSYVRQKIKTYIS